MAGLTMSTRQRRGAAETIEDAVSVAGENSFRGQSYRAFLAGDSASLRQLLDLAGVTPEAWAARLARYQAAWDRAGAGR